LIIFILRNPFFQANAPGTPTIREAGDFKGQGAPDIEIVDGPGRRKPVSAPGQPGIGGFVLSFLFLFFRGFLAAIYPCDGRAGMTIQGKN
jgi:hypothetical protein